jgi:GntP family gluconate:H+ symporter
MNPLLLLIIGIIVVLGGILIIRLHPVLALIIAALVVGGLTSDALLERYALEQKFSEAEVNAFLDQSIGRRIANAFGNTCGKVGLLIVFASIIGKCLIESGAAERIVRSAVNLLGEKRAPLSFMGSSFVLAIPVFFDTVFYLMIPLARAMGMRNQKSYALYIMAIIAGGTMAHSLIPPTPGPLFAAGALGVSVGLMIIMGGVVGLCCASSGLLYGMWLNKRQNIPVRSTSDTSVEEVRGWSNKESSQLPSLFLSLLPILLPVILIAGGTILSNLDSPINEEVRAFFDMAGDSVVALFVATVIALFIVLKQHAYNISMFKKPIEDSLYSAGMIILITSSGGAFGAMLQQTSIGSWLADMTSGYTLAALPLGFFIAAIIRTAQGSATVSMITAVGMLSAFSNPEALGFHPVYLAIVIGCGSKLFPWMNDSGFWIICKMSGFTETETIRNFSVLLSIMGLTGLFVTMILAKLFPLI